MFHYKISFPLNRKEEKKHGEKGKLIGGNIKNKKVIILDDVITSGISINYSIKIIEKENSKISAIFVLLDRKEKKEHNSYKKNFLKSQKNHKINSIITINDLIIYLSKKKKFKKYASKLIEYHEKYGIY